MACQPAWREFPSAFKEHCDAPITRSDCSLPLHPDSNELKPFNIELVTVAPGAFRTAMMDLGILPKETYDYSRYAKRQCEQHILDVEQGPDPAPVFDAVIKSCTESNPPLRRLAGDAVQVLQPCVDILTSYQDWFKPLPEEVPE